MIATAHSWHDIDPRGDSPDIFRAVIEIGFKGKEEAMKCIIENIKRYNDQIKPTLNK